MDFLLPAGNWTGGSFGWTYLIGELGRATHVWWFGFKVPRDVEVFVVTLLPIILLVGGMFLFAHLWDRKKRKAKEGQNDK